MPASPGPSSPPPELSTGSPERFGYSWAIFDEILPLHEEQFRRWSCGVQPEEWQGARVLDVGCGMGRNSYWAAKWGAADVVGIDVDEQSLSAARRLLASVDNARAEFGSAYDIPYRDVFDIVFSVGVIHHLDDPDRALAEMTATAKPGGKVMIWVYGYENNEWIPRYFDPVRNALFSKLPLPLVFFLSLVPTAALWLLLKLGWGKLDYHDLLRQVGFWHLRHIVFDQMIPRIAHYWRREEVESLMNQAGLADIRLEWVNQMSWMAVGRKPEAGSPA